MWARSRNFARRITQSDHWTKALAGRLTRLLRRALGGLATLVNRLLQPGFWTTLLMVGLIVLVGWELTRERIYVEPFGVPPALAARGYSAEAVPSLILDQVAAIQAEAQTRKKRQKLEAEWRIQDIDIPGVGISIRPLVRFLRGTLGLPETRVQGSLLCSTGACEPGEIAITLRVERGGRPGDGTTLRSFARKDDKIEPLLRAAARFLLQELDTYVLAAYLVQTRPLDEDPDARDARDAEIMALLDLIQARDHAEDLAYAQSLRGLVLSGQGNQGAALEAYEAFAALDPEAALGATTYVNWAKSLAAQGDLDAAFAKLDEASAIDPNDPYVLATRGELLLRAGREEEAIPVLQQALAREPDNAVARLLLAGALEETGQTEAAEVERDRAMADDPAIGTLVKQQGGIVNAALAVANAPNVEIANIVSPTPIQPPEPIPVEPPEPITDPTPEPVVEFPPLPDPIVPPAEPTNVSEPIRVTALPPLPGLVIPPAEPTDVPPIPDTTAGGGPDGLPVGGGPVVEPPAPEAPEPPAPLTVYFEIGSPRLAPEGLQALAAFAAALAELPELAVSITGHTDRVGTAARNEQLSLQRAAAVKAALEAEGLSPERLGVGGRGESDPAVATPDDVPEAANRRVEVVVLVQ